MKPWLEAAQNGDRRALARLLSWVEDGTPEGQAALQELYPRTGQAHVIGITGAPGAGKSTLVGRLARAFRAQVAQLAIIAVDPSSPFSGGALLGDRLRMPELSNDPGTFIRSMASRGQSGGLSRATRDLVTVFDALGCPIILVETVGAGQSEVDIARVAHTIVLVEAPGMGDEIQALKAGVMEIADIVVVNKADRPEAQQTVKALRAVLHEVSSAGHHGAQAQTEGPGYVTTESWEVPILETVAIENTGISELIEAIRAHRAYLESSGLWQKRLERQARADLETWLQRYLLAALESRLGAERLQEEVARLVARTANPLSAAQALLREAGILPLASATAHSSSFPESE